MSTYDVIKARAFAIKAHGDQKYGEKPYLVHLEDVVGIVEPYGEEAQVVGYLHDVVEDTSHTLDEIRSVFGKHVADCVVLLTDPPGGDRAEKKEKSHQKLSQVKGDLELALIVKAADRLANVRASMRDGNEKKLAKYRGEHVAFRAAAYRAGLCDAFWREIDRLIAGTTP
jgi:guanosine-3',5'-bis(diphosphate) 3'-pyrophosphohydrolase